jgi:Flp pilus assembly protein TadD
MKSRILIAIFLGSILLQGCVPFTHVYIPPANSEMPKSQLVHVTPGDQATVSKINGISIANFDFYVIPGTYSVSVTPGFYTISMNGHPMGTATYANGTSQLVVDPTLSGKTMGISDFLALNPNFFAEVSSNANMVFVDGAMARRREGDFVGAIADCTEAIQIQPHDAAAYLFRGQAKLDKGDFEGAITDCTKAIELDSVSAEGAYFNRGLARKAKGDLVGATADLAKTHRTLEQTDADSFFLNGNQMLYLHDFDDAIADYTKAIQLRPDFGLAYQFRGMAKQAKGDMEGAGLDFRCASKGL